MGLKMWREEGGGRVRVERGGVTIRTPNYNFEILHLVLSSFLV